MARDGFGAGSDDDVAEWGKRPRLGMMVSLDHSIQLLSRAEK
ncbi:hypothetical protein NHJ13734_008058, partial [Beauveria thailandica]